MLNTPPLISQGVVKKGGGLFEAINYWDKSTKGGTLLFFVFQGRVRFGAPYPPPPRIKIWLASQSHILLWKPSLCPKIKWSLPFSQKWRELHEYEWTALTVRKSGVHCLTCFFWLAFSSRGYENKRPVLDQCFFYPKTHKKCKIWHNTRFPVQPMITKSRRISAIYQHFAEILGIKQRFPVLPMVFFDWLSIAVQKTT